MKQVSLTHSASNVFNFSFFFLTFKIKISFFMYWLSNHDIFKQELGLAKVWWMPRQG